MHTEQETLIIILGERRLEWLTLGSFEQSSAELVSLRDDISLVLEKLQTVIISHAGTNSCFEGGEDC